MPGGAFPPPPGQIFFIKQRRSITLPVRPSIGWRVHKVGFGEPITHQCVVEMNVLDLSDRNDEHLERAFLLSKEGWKRSRLGEYHL